MKVVAIVPAAGSGKRLKRKIDKPFIKLKSKPLLVYTLDTLNSSSYIDNIILVVVKKHLDRARRLVKKYNINKMLGVIEGGKRRSDSVFNGLKKLPENTDYVFIHDGARPFLSKVLIARCISAVKIYGACIAGIPVKPTIKIVKNNFVAKTLNRKTLCDVQTPQVFKKDIILKAYKNKKFVNIATDDAWLVEKTGYKVRVVTGSEKNIKITTEEDLLLANALLTNKHKR